MTTVYSSGAPTAGKDRRSPSRPIRVAIVHYRDDATAGGSLRVGETLASSLHVHKVDVHLVFAYGGPGPVSRRASVRAHFIGSTGPGNMAAWLRAQRLFRAINPDVIHFMDGVIWLQCALLFQRYLKLLHVHGRFLTKWIS